MELKKYISYCRVSTQKQDYGLTAQETDINNFINKTNGLIIARYVEKESGRDDKRTQLLNAIEECKANKAILIVSKLDRLSRSIKFLFALKDSNVNFVVVDNPDLNTLTLGIFATIAQHEAELISKRTVAGLKVARDKGKILGRIKGSKLTQEHKQNTSNSIKEHHKQHKQDILNYIMKNENIHSFNIDIIVNLLNNNGFKTREGNNYNKRSVKNILINKDKYLS